MTSEKVGQQGANLCKPHSLYHVKAEMTSKISLFWLITFRILSRFCLDIRLPTSLTVNIFWVLDGVAVGHTSV